jgi:hypothetical protein
MYIAAAVVPDCQNLGLKRKIGRLGCGFKTKHHAETRINRLLELIASTPPGNKIEAWQ